MLKKKYSAHFYAIDGNGSAFERFESFETHNEAEQYITSKIELLFGRESDATKQHIKEFLTPYTTNITEGVDCCLNFVQFHKKGLASIFVMHIDYELIISETKKLIERTK